MVRKIVIPHNSHDTINIPSDNIPSEYLNRTVEILVLPFDNGSTLDSHVVGEFQLTTFRCGGKY